MENVGFIIHRKAAFAGAFLPYRIYINGKFAGIIKNGRTLNVEVPKADVYYLADDFSFLDGNAVICNRSLSEYNIVLKRAGGWRTESYNEFYINIGEQISPLPSFHFEKFRHAVFEDRIHELSSDEQLLALCLEFWCGFADDIQEVLASEHLTEIIDALQKIGAAQYADFLLHIINELFSGVSLPLSDEQIEQMNDRIGKANRLIWKEESAWEELHRGLAKHITSKLNNNENVY